MSTTSAPAVESRSPGVTAAEGAPGPIEVKEHPRPLPSIPGEAEWRRRAAQLARLLDEWMTDESGYDEEAWPELQAALDQDRPSYRKLFDE